MATISSPGLGSGLNVTSIVDQLMAVEQKPIDLLTFPEEGHGFDKAENEVKWLETLEAFLTKHNPAD